MPKFRKKPVVIEAVQFTEENAEEISSLEDVDVYYGGNFYTNPGELLFARIETEEGTMKADPGDWIITGVQGERYPCKPDIFEETYERV